MKSTEEVRILLSADPTGTLSADSIFINIKILGFKNTLKHLIFLPLVEK